jgi:malate permease and related proteins
MPIAAAAGEHLMYPHALWIALVMLGLGVLFRWLKLLPDSASEVLNKLVLNLFFPALVLVAVTQVQIHAQMLWVPVIAFVVMGLSAAAVLIATRAFKLARDVEGALLLTAVLGNTAFLGYPICKAYMGEAALPVAILYDQLGSFVVFSSFGLWIAASYGGGKAPGWLMTVKKIFSFPAFIALLLGVSLNIMNLTIPNSLMLILRDIASLLVPMAMFAVGLNFRLMPPAGQSMALCLGLSIKMVLAPLFALGIAFFLLDHKSTHIVALQAAMPPMVTAAALAADAKLAPQLSAAMAGFGILLALVWLPLVHQWLAHL